MKKIFFFAATMLAAVSMNAENVFDWTQKVGSVSLVGNVTETTIKTQKNTTDTPCLSFANGYTVPEGGTATNYAELSIDGGFKAGDVVVIDYCYNNTQEKVATVAVYNTSDEQLVESSNGVNARLVDGVSTFQYELAADMASMRIARGKTGKTTTAITRLEVVRGGVVIDKAGTPVFSVTGGTYFEPFKVGLSSAMADKIYYSIDEGDFVEFSENDSIEIAEYDVDIKVSAFATLEGAANSDTVEATYKLKHFVARPVFKARKEYTFAGITAEQINILSPATAEKSTYNLDGKDVPSVNYIHMTHEERDSFMLVSVKDYSDVTFRYKNSANQNNTMKFAADYLQIDKKGFELWIENVQAGDTIVFVVTAKGSTPHFDHTYSSSCYLDPYMPADKTDPCYNMMGYVFTTSDAAIEDNYSGWTDLVYTVQSGRNRVRIKELDNGYRIAKILVGAYRGVEAVDNVNATVKAIKTIENGQLVIIKNGVRYNALGAQL